jgi:hypothetical protein
MVIKNLWKNTEQRKPNYPEKEVHVIFSVHYKFHMHRPGLKPGLHHERPATIHLRYGMSIHSTFEYLREIRQYV